MKLAYAALLLFSVLLGPQLTFAQTKELPKFDRELALQGVTAEYSESGYQALTQVLLQKSLTMIRSTDKDSQEIGASVLELSNLMADMADSPQAEKQAQYNESRQLLYSVIANMQTDQSQSFKEKLRVALSIPNNITLRLPYLDPVARNKKRSANRNSNESELLVNKQTGQIYTDTSQLVDLSPNQISEFDILDSNTLLYSDKQIEQRRALSTQKGLNGSLFALFESEMEETVSLKLGRPYDLASARRWIFFDGIKDSATSPKIEAKDAYGIKWKAKWGEEIQTEPVANRLYLEIGGRYTDLVYGSLAGINETLLVLDAPTPESLEPSNCQKVATAQKLQACLLTSKYQFDVTPYIQRVGTIKEADLNLKPKDQSPGGQREYIVFKEMSLEFQAPKSAYHRLGAAGTSTAATEKDRAYRALSVFSSWLHNRDAKDSNNKGVIPGQNPEGYFEYIHDLGSSMGGLRSTGSLNDLGYGRRFVQLTQNRVIYNGVVLYQPRAFKNATWADQRWMVRRIASIPRASFEAAVSSAPWPTFMHRILLYRLTQRQNDLIDVFLSKSDRLPTSDPQSLALRYNPRNQLPAGLSGFDASADDLRSEIQSLGLTDEQDIVVIRNKEPFIRTCEESAVINVLERDFFPTGLSRRTKRATDDKPLKKCKYLGSSPRRS